MCLKFKKGKIANLYLKHNLLINLFLKHSVFYDEAQAALTSFKLALQRILLLKVTNCDTKLVSHTISSDNSLNNACQTLSSQI